MNNKYKDKRGRYEFKPVTVETVDQAVKDYFDKKLNAHVETPNGRKKVPVMIASGERWKILRNKGIRDENKTLILPLITVQRVDIDRTPGFSSLPQDDRSFTISKRLHQKIPFLQNLNQNRVQSGFPSEKKELVVYETLTVPMPDTCTIFYQIIIWTQYMTQMNEILEKIFYMYDWKDSFAIPKDYDDKGEPQGSGYFFVGFREGNVSSQTNFQDFIDQERIIRYQYFFKVSAFFVLDPKDRPLAYGKDEDGKFVEYKDQTVTNVVLKESIISAEEFEKLMEKTKSK